MWQTTCQQIFLGSKLNEASSFLLYQFNVSSAENYIFISPKWKYISCYNQEDNEKYVKL